MITMTNLPAAKNPRFLEGLLGRKERRSGPGRLSSGPRGLASLAPSDLRRGDQGRQVLRCAPTGSVIGLPLHEGWQ